MASSSSPQLDLKRLEFAQKTICEYGDEISLESRKNILVQRVTIGMSPYEAYLAAGQFAFKVQADPSRWPGDVDPYRVMWGQSTKPDNSEIWMAFETSTQFPERGLTRFRVHFVHGRAAAIDVLRKGDK